MASNLEALTFDIQLDTSAFEQGVRNVEAILQQLVGGAFQTMGQSVNGIAQNLLGIGNAGGAMGSALMTGGNAAVSALQNVQNATRGVVVQTQQSALKVEGLWTNAARRIEFSMRQALRSFVGPMAAVFGISTMFNQYTGTADRLGKFSQSMDINLADLQGWSEAAIRAGGSAEGFQGSLRSLNRQLQMMTATTGKKAKKGGAAAGGMMGGGLGQLLKELKIDPKENGKTKDVFQLLTEIAGGAEKMDKQAFAGLAMRSRIDQGTIQLLQKGREEVERVVKRQKLLGGYTEEDTKIAAEFKDAIADLTQVFKVFAAIIMRTVTPIIRAFADGLVALFAVINQNKEIVTWLIYVALSYLVTSIIPKILVGLTALKTSALTLAGNLVFHAHRVITTVVLGLRAMTTGVAGLRLALSSLWATLAPILAAIAVPFIIEDIIAFFSGKASMIGVIIYNLKQWKEKLRKSIEEFYDWIKEKTQKLIQDLLDLMPNWMKKLFGIETDPQTGKVIEKAAVDEQVADEGKRRTGRAAMESAGTIVTEKKDIPKTEEKDSEKAKSASPAVKEANTAKNAPPVPAVKKEPDVKAPVAKAAQKAPDAEKSSKTQEPAKAVNIDVKTEKQSKAAEADERARRIMERATSLIIGSGMSDDAAQAEAKRQIDEEDAENASPKASSNTSNAANAAFMGIISQLAPAKDKNAVALPAEQQMQGTDALGTITQKILEGLSVAASHDAKDGVVQSIDDHRTMKIDSQLNVTQNFASENANEAANGMTGALNRDFKNWYKTLGVQFMNSGQNNVGGGSVVTL